MTVESRVPNRAALGAALGQNRPPHSIGITGRIRPEYAVALDGLSKCPTGSGIVSSTHRRLGQPSVVGRAGIEARRRPERGRRLRELPRLQLRLALSVPLVGTALGLGATLDDQQRGTNHHPAQAS